MSKEIFNTPGEYVPHLYGENFRMQEGDGKVVCCSGISLLTLFGEGGWSVTEYDRHAIAQRQFSDEVYFRQLVESMSAGNTDSYVLMSKGVRCVKFMSTRSRHPLK